MKAALPALLIVLSLAACRGDEPDEAPPVGRTTVASVPVELGALAPTVPVDPLAQADAAARFALDVAWAACGDGRDPAATRCRDDAFVAYDAAMAKAAAGPMDGADTAASVSAAHPSAHAAPAARADLAAAQRSGTRG